MANVIKILEQQLILRLLEERKQYMSRFKVDFDYMKGTNKLMRVLADEKENQVAKMIIKTPFMNQETIVNLKQNLN